MPQMSPFTMIFLNSSFCVSDLRDRGMIAWLIDKLLGYRRVQFTCRHVGKQCSRERSIYLVIYRKKAIVIKIHGDGTWRRCIVPCDPQRENERHSSAPFANLQTGRLFPNIYSTTFFTGVIQVQAYRYFRRFHDDTWFVKLIVSAMWLSQMFFSFLVVAAKDQMLPHSHRYSLPSSRKKTLAEKMSFFQGVHDTWALIATTLVHLFFASRLWLYSRGLLALLTSAILIIGTLANDIVFSKSRFGEHSAVTKLATIWNSMIKVGTDLFISIYLIYIMMKQRSAVQSTNSIMRRIILHGVATGVLSSVLALFVLISVNLSWIPASLLMIPTSLHMRPALRARFPIDQSIMMTAVRDPSCIGGSARATNSSSLEPTSVLTSKTIEPRTRAQIGSPDSTHPMDPHK
ncbi:hypothetical protein DL93DRAFT_2103568 [Clavulina sp. PMI_390]|nr:hypothetical protein DL93DRAFT_2103568 [Clavulina sp. PMI_390]